MWLSQLQLLLCGLPNGSAAMWAPLVAFASEAVSRRETDVRHGNRTVQVYCPTP